MKVSPVDSLPFAVRLLSVFDGTVDAQRLRAATREALKTCRR